MEDLDSHESKEDFSGYVLSCFGNSMQEAHQRICAAISTLSEELIDQDLPLTPNAYFTATVTLLDRLSVVSELSDPAITTLVTILSMILPKLSPVVLRKKRAFASKPLLRILRSGSASNDALTSGFDCIQHLLVAGDKVNWSEMSQLYGVLLTFVCHSRPEVRQQSHCCLRVVLQSFQMSSVLAPASEGITNIFNRIYLLSNKSNSAGSEGQKRDQEILYVLDALKDCLPLMFMKSMTVILKSFKTLLERHQSDITKRITDILRTLCSHPTSEVAHDVLLDLLCSLALSVPLNEKSVDDMTATARLLNDGIRKVYSLNRQICIVKLPLVFNSLAEILACEHKEALCAAIETMKSLIHACIDDGMVKQGVDQIKANGDGDTRRSGPTIIEKICATIDSLLGYRYNKVWDMAFQVISTIFDKLGEDSAYLLKGTLKNLADVQKLTDNDFPYRKQLHDCVGSALRAIGPENFLSVLPLDMESEDLRMDNVWLFPILKQYTIGGRLSFFLKSILAVAGLIRQKSMRFKQEGRIVSSRAAEALIYSLWSLLPAFCNYPLDTAYSFKALEKALGCAIRVEPDVRGIICSSLQILIQQNKSLLEGNHDLLGNDISISEHRARARYTKQVAEDNLSALRSSAHEILSVLYNIFLESSKDGGYLQSTIGEFASISDKAVVKSFFRSTIKKLLKVTQEAVKVDQPKKSNSILIDKENGSSLLVARAQLLDLAVSFLPGLDVEEVDFLYVAIKPALQDDEGLIQKKAYKILSIILKDRFEFLSAKHGDLLQLMIEVLPFCHFSAKRHRLDCLYLLLVHVAQDTSEPRKHDIISSFLTEIILALKEANRKTRNRAYDILVQIGHAYGDEEKGGKKENLQLLFHMVAGGLAGETPQMISAAIKGLARLAYEFSDLISAAYNVLPSAFLLLQRKNRTIIKANLGLLKVLVAKSQAEWLELHLKSLVEGLLKWQDDTKNHLKAKVKLLLEMLVKKCGLDAVKAVIPEEHMKLLSNIRKIKERKERRIAANSEVDARSLHSKATTSRISRWNHTKIFSDFGDEETEDSDLEYMESKASGKSGAASKFNSKASTLRTKQARRMTTSLQEDLFDKLEDGPLDLLDRRRTRSALQSSGSLKRKQESDDEPEIDSEGRLVIHEGGRPKVESPSNPVTDAGSELGSYMSAKSKSLTGTQRKRKKTSDSGWAYTGNEYASKKAGGDVKRKDKFEPYAYWPLDRKMMSHRPEHRAAARKGMASVVKLTKKLEGKSASGALALKKGLTFKKSHGKGGKKSR